MSDYYNPTGADRRRLGRLIRRRLRWLTPNGEVRTRREKLWAADIYRMLRAGQAVQVEHYDSVIILRP